MSVTCCCTKVNSLAMATSSDSDFVITLLDCSKVLTKPWDSNKVTPLELLHINVIKKISLKTRI